MEAAHGPAYESLVEDLRGTVLIFCPMAGGINHRLGFARDSSSSPLRNRDEAGMPQASQARNSVYHTIGEIAGRHQMLESIGGAQRNVCSHHGKSTHLFPEPPPIPPFALRNLAHPLG